MKKPGRLLVASRVLLWSTVLVILAAAPPYISGVNPGSRPGLLLTMGILLGIWTWFWWRFDTAGSSTSALAAVLVMSLLLAVLTAYAEPGRDALILAALAAGAGLGLGRAAVTIAGVALIAGAIQVMHSAPLNAPGVVVNDLVAGAAAIGARQLVLTNRKLEEARDEITRLAVAGERLRLGRDLHDLLGQHLTLAVLKSELVARELPPDTPDRLRAAQREVTAAVRDSLDDVRTAVVGYREVGLGTELATARAVLDAAGIVLTVENDLGSVPNQQEEVLVWVLRESVTNVIRHSRATRCLVRLRREDSSALLDIEDDGLGGGGHGGDGSGLKGVAERAAAVGGSFAAKPGERGGYRVSISLPLSRA